MFNEHPIQITKAMWEILLATVREVIEKQHQHTRQIGELMSTVTDLQNDESKLASAVSAETSALATLDTTLTTSFADIQTEIAALKAAQPSLDLTSLEASIAQAQTNLSAITAATAQGTAADPGAPAPAGGTPAS